MARALAFKNSVLTLVLIFFAGLFSACEQDNESAKKKAPFPGSGRRPQIFVLSQKDTLLFERFSYPRQGVSDEFRIEASSFSNPKEADETLRALNGRPTDVLFLGRGLPQTRWLELKLSRVTGRRLLWEESEHNAPEGAWTLHLKTKGVDTLFATVCAEAEGGCHVKSLDGSEIYKAPPKSKSHDALFVCSGANVDSSQCALELKVDWERLLSHLLLLNASGPSSRSKIEVGLAGDFLKINSNSNLMGRSGLSTEKFSLLRKAALMEEIGAKVENLGRELEP